ncbi:hypothetical protein PC9H_009433 [Pleurotus ostreatus]|uniref:Zn(2)-C6 fungal-type domain-containing protein n=1 Tax=Pleurotus ostreatus TaxID=5322 RepID=A0A8H6ZTP5_PLEOS|nr:uncharacterized protein PC9H_009433 [Pleurotus ostreatus]KAF7424130.1 hypothetical protein PC9H_009433 [Pleurotus ostreatus]
MAYRSPGSSPSEAEDTLSSSNVSPSSTTSPLAMIPASVDGSDSPSSRSNKGTPNRIPLDLPRTQTASKGGCWTCRLRRKKCDEQREGDSCRTCIRLKIKCLGWGSKRPDWMRDKQEVERYKADIKAQLTRAGLIRGQPRTNPISTPANLPSTASSSSMSSGYRHTADPGPSSSSHPREYHHHPSNSLDFGYHPLGQPQPPHPNSRQSRLYHTSAPQHSHYMPEMPGKPLISSSLAASKRLSNSIFGDLPPASFDPTLAPTMDPTSSNFFSAHDFGQPSTSPSSAPGSSSATPALGLGGTTSQYPLEFGIVESSSTGFGQSFGLPTPNPTPIFPDQSSQQQTNLQGDLVMYYFENVRKVQYIFAGNSVTNVTYSLILQEPRGAVTNAVCALASLHHTAMRVAQGLEPPDPNPEFSTARYFHDEAYLQLVNSKAMRGHYNEADAIAALHLVSFSLFSGGATNWRQVLSVAYEWVAQLGLPADENAQPKLMGMRPIEQVIVKTTMWFDIFSSVSFSPPPRFLGLWKYLLTPGYWPSHLPGDDLTSPTVHSSSSPIHMEALMGCPDDAVLAIGEISALAHWKENELRKGTLSIRELLRRGDLIEAALRQNHGDIFNSPGSPLHPNLAQSASNGNGELSSTPQPAFPTDDMRRVIASIFRESAVLYLQTVLNGCNPGVIEISQSVDQLVHLLQQLPRSELDRSLVFPICIAGCMTDSSPQREFIKGRLQAQDEGWGNIRQTRALMELVWRKRDVEGSADWRQMLWERPMPLLLV